MDSKREKGGGANSIVKAVARLLRPVVHLLVRNAVPFPRASELLKEIYVDVGARDFTVPGKPQTDSRVNLLTGVHRKDVKRLRATRRGRFASPRSASLATQVLARWTTQARYLDADGRPRPLPLRASARQGASFETLVRSVSTDIRPRVILDEWLRIGLAEIDGDRRVRLKSEAFVPRQGSDEIAYYFGRNAHDHLASAVHNLAGGEPPFLERSVAYNHLTAEDAEELHKLARRRGTELLHELNARALELQQRRSAQPGATARMAFGVYFFSEDEAADETDGDDGGDA
jgi:hypothetical protein